MQWFELEPAKSIIRKIATDEGVPEEQVIEILVGTWEVTEAAIRNDYDYTMIPNFGKFIKRGSPIRELKQKN